MQFACLLISSALHSENSNHEDSEQGEETDPSDDDEESCSSMAGVQAAEMK